MKFTRETLFDPRESEVDICDGCKRFENYLTPTEKDGCADVVL